MKSYTSKITEIKDGYDEKIKMDDFVLVKVVSKRSIKYFIAEIINLHKENHEIQYLEVDTNSYNILLRKIILSSPATLYW